MQLLNTLARAISLIAATCIVLLVALYPRLIATESSEIPFEYLPLWMIGMSCAWVHGFGFVPQNRILRIVFSPIVAWPIIAFGIWGIFLK